MQHSVDELRKLFSYDVENGRLIKLVAEGKGNSARLGVGIGGPDGEGYRSAVWRGKKFRTARLVWAWHHGVFPKYLRHKNGDKMDDRVENLEILKKSLPIAYVSDGKEVSEYGTLPDDFGGGIYEIFCIKNGRRYIGSAVNIQKRWRQHYTALSLGKHHTRHLQKAWDKHGENGFVFRVVDRCEAVQLIVREQHYIDSLKPEFNSNPVAGSMLGHRHSESSRKKMSDSRPKDFSPMTGKSHTEETKRRISQSRKGKGGGPRSPERLAKISAALKGRQVSPEMRARISKTLTGTSTGRGKLNPDQVRKIRDLRDKGLGRIRIAKQMGITPSAANAVIGNHAYGWVK